MVKKYVIISLIGMAVMPLYGSDVENFVDDNSLEQQLETAITTLNVAEVKALSAIEGILTEENRQRFVVQAEEKVNSCRENVSVWRSPKDAAKFVGGVVAGVAGIGLTCISAFHMACNAHRHFYNPEDDLALSVGGVCISAFGFITSKKASACPTTTQLLEQAEEILRLVSGGVNMELLRRSEEKLAKAIEDTNLEEAKALLEKEGIITQENRQKLLDQAEEKIEYYEDNISVWHSKIDSIRYVGGFFGGLVGVGLIGWSRHEIIRKSEEAKRTHGWYNPDNELAIGTCGFSAAMIGFLVNRQALKCQAARERLAQAEALFDLIERAPVINLVKKIE